MQQNFYPRKKVNNTGFLCNNYSPLSLNCSLDFMMELPLGCKIKRGKQVVVHWKCHWHQSSLRKTQKMRLPHKLQKITKNTIHFYHRQRRKHLFFAFSNIIEKTLSVLAMRRIFCCRNFGIGSKEWQMGILFTLEAFN